MSDDQMTPADSARVVAAKIQLAKKPAQSTTATRPQEVPMATPAPERAPVKYIWLNVPLDFPGQQETGFKCLPEVVPLGACYVAAYLPAWNHIEVKCYRSGAITATRLIPMYMVKQWEPA